MYSIVALIGLVTSATVLSLRPPGDWMRGAALAMTSGFLAGNAFFMEQSVGLFTHSISTGDWSAWQNWLPYVLVLFAVSCALSNIPFMLRALEEYDALFVIPVIMGCQILTSCLSAAVILQELDLIPVWRRVLYCLAVVLILIGLGVVTNGQKPKSSQLETGSTRENGSKLEYDLERMGQSESSYGTEAPEP